MTLPESILLIRHGESEGNVMERLAQSGRLPPDVSYPLGHSSGWRLTEKGRREAEQAGVYVRAMGFAPFTLHLVSPFRRARETACYLALEAEWDICVELRERDKRCEVVPGESSTCEARKSSPFYWSPPDGESIAQLMTRAQIALQYMEKHAPDGSVLAVSHVQFMRAFLMVIGKFPPEQFEEPPPDAKSLFAIQNCGMLEFKRSRGGTRYNRVRAIRPTPAGYEQCEWQLLKKPSYRDRDLLAVKDDSSDPEEVLLAYADE